MAFTTGTVSFPCSMADFERIRKLTNWICYGLYNPQPYDSPLPEHLQNRHIVALLDQASWFDAQDGLDPPTLNNPTGFKPDWVCGCGETLRGNETVCWKCGGLQNP